MERVSVGPWVVMGRNNIVHMGAVIGHAPQDLSYNGEETWTHIGSGNEIREYATIHRGSGSGLRTVVGDHNLLMGLSHVAHDVEIGNHVILANGALLAGHVHVEDRAFVSGGVLVHQFVRIGRLALLRGGSRTSRDVPPFCIMDGTHTVRSLNRVGLKRAGVSSEERAHLKRPSESCSDIARWRRNLFWVLKPMPARLSGSLSNSSGNRRGAFATERANCPILTLKWVLIMIRKLFLGRDAQ